ncbi:leucine-rich repeat flightless-interacting protein 2-like isoform X1 [Salarias fasciatus]|uniref:leucine-rich repeat flightless-interacting protein 2-like isoform X1 n=1 Tax=Salarias fasciatus TaxID=181472 RepID=UPI001176E640|nr:leucine-rich repeat flightless-interacting protein 2-like isoform X1 [Salarias fasciatus]
MGTQGPGRKRIPNREKLTAEDDALNQIAREAEARLAVKRAARAEARDIRMKELERQQKEMFHSHKRYYGLEFGHIEQWMEDSERYCRFSRRHASVSDDEERMSVGSRGSLRVEERTDRDFLEKGSRTASTLSAATLASLGGASSRRGSCDTSFSVETEASIREIKDSLADAEEKYRKAMVSNAQLHNDKCTLMYQVEALKEELGDMEEALWEARRRGDDTNKELERERQAHSVLQFHFKEIKESLTQTEELLTEVSELRLRSNTYRQDVSDLQEELKWKEKKIAALERQREMSELVVLDRDRLREKVMRQSDLLKKHGVVVSPDVTTNGETDDHEVGSELAEESSPGARESMLELRVKKLLEERHSLQDQVRLLRTQLEERPAEVTDGMEDPEGAAQENGMDVQLLELQRDTNRQISELKFKLVKSEQEVAALEQNVIRLDGQVTRYKTASENAEKIEDELKVEKRKLQRELRAALDRVDELEVTNGHLSKRLEKMKANRTALLAQQ